MSEQEIRELKALLHRVYVRIDNEHDRELLLHYVNRLDSQIHQGTTGINNS